MTENRSFKNSFVGMLALMVLALLVMLPVRVSAAEGDTIEYGATGFYHDNKADPDAVPWRIVEENGDYVLIIGRAEESFTFSSSPSVDESESGGTRRIQFWRTADVRNAVKSIFIVFFTRTK